VTDNGGLTDVAQTTVQVTNVPPTVTSVTAAPANTLTGQSITVTGAATDPSVADTSAGFTWSFDTGSGFGSFGANGLVTSYSTCGTRTVAAKAKDKDGGASIPVTSNAVHVYTGSVLAPLVSGAVNLVSKGQAVPVKITVGCNGFLSGLHPAISIQSGTTTTSGVMREDTPGQLYIYNFAVPSNAAAGQVFTVLVRPFGGTSPTLTVLLKIKK